MTNNCHDSPASARRLHRETVDFLHDLAAWTLFFSLTFRKPVTVEEALGAVKEYCQAIARLHEHQHVRFAWFGGQQQGGRIHIHILGATIPCMEFKSSSRELERLWRHGNAEVEDVHDRAAVVSYLMRKKHDFWNTAIACDRACPCRRKHGCRHGGRWPSPLEVTHQ
ncbi:MAG: hypothetical protein PHU25_15185 [Deltaproteobacteria bacterium]|nr:hypothetical protein [Deltaproteobacteria bacterium]